MRVAASVAVTALVSSALAGCMLVTPQQTARSYTPSDGVNASVGDVHIRNVLLVTGEGETTSANMLGVLTNDADSASTVTLQYETTGGTESTTVTVPAKGLLSLRPNVDQQGRASVTTRARSVSLEDVDVPPGGLFTVGFSSGGGDPVSVRVPVLTGTLEEYSGLVPTPTASAAPDVEPSESGAPGGADDDAPTR